MIVSQINKPWKFGENDLTMYQLLLQTFFLFKILTKAFKTVRRKTKYFPITDKQFE